MACFSVLVFAPFGLLAPFVPIVLTAFLQVSLLTRNRNALLTTNASTPTTARVNANAMTPIPLNIRFFMRNLHMLKTPLDAGDRNCHLALSNRLRPLPKKKPTCPYPFGIEHVTCFLMSLRDTPGGSSFNLPKILRGFYQVHPEKDTALVKWLDLPLSESSFGYVSCRFETPICRSDCRMLSLLHLAFAGLQVQD